MRTAGDVREPAAGRLAFIVPALYVLSGAAALILEVTWSRLLTLQFGHTTGATSTVLAAFMGGLAAGSAAGGWLAERSDRRQALVRYAVLEATIAVAAIALLLVLGLATPLLAWAYADGDSPARFGVARVAVSLLALALPTMAMGATYPLAMRALTLDARRAGAFAGLLYTANTIGAAGGALLAGFVLLPAVGIRATTLVAAGLNVVAAGVSWWLSRSASTSTSSSSPAVPADLSPANHQRDRRSQAGPAVTALDRPFLIWLGLVATATFGLVALINQVVWTRVLALIVGPTTFAFSAMVGVFIAGLALGAGIGGAIVARLASRAEGGGHAGQAGHAARAGQSVDAPPASLAGSARGASAGRTELAAAAGRAHVVTRRAATSASTSTLDSTSASWLGAIAILLALATTVAMQLTGRVLLWIATTATTEPSATFGATVARQLGVAALLVGPISVMSGAAFPLALAVVGGRDGLTPTRLSWTYAANTTGAIVGALLTGFLLIPAIGLQAALRCGALAVLIVGLVLLVSCTISWRGRALAASLALIVAAAVVTRATWNPALLSAGAYRFAPLVPADDLEAVLTAGDLLFYDEGAAGTVAVRRLGGTTSLIIDGKPDASNAADMLTQKLLAHLPLLLHPSPGQVGILGLGSGVTAGAALTHPIARVDAIEISPGVVRASQFFRAENRDALEDPRMRLLIADGRSQLRLADARYDVVISEPSNPWMAGVAALFTRELMMGVRERLTPGGLFCQWTHTYDMAAADLQSIVATFLDVFPHASLWLVGESDVLLIGSMSPAAILGDAATLAARMSRAGVAEDLRSVAVSSATDLLGLRMADTEALRRYAAGAPVQTDDRMALEFSAPRSLAARTGRDNVTALLALSPANRGSSTGSDNSAGVLDAVTSAPWASRGRMLLRAEAYALAFDALTRAVALRSRERDPHDSRGSRGSGGSRGPRDHQDGLLDDLVRAAGAAGKADVAIAQLRDVVAGSPVGDPAGGTVHAGAESGVHAARHGVAARVALARLLMAKGDADGAVNAVAPVAGADSQALTELASILADLGDPDRLAPIVADLDRLAPASPDTQYFTAALAFLRGNPTEALLKAQALIAGAPPGDARTHNLIGAALATLGDATAARTAFARSIDADPRDPDAYVNAGSLELDHGDPHTASRHFAAALTLDPTNDAARRGLASTRAAR